MIDVRGELYYQAPDSFHGIWDAEGSAFQEVIVLGSRAWTRDSRGWSAADPEPVRFLVTSQIEAVRAMRNHEDVRDIGAGPPVEGESTRRYALSAPDLGRNMAAAAENQIDAHPEFEEYLAAERDAWRDVRGSVELVIGEDSDRIYRVSLAMEGTELSGELVITIDMYDEPFEIEPPT
jgi:hypothetical protein